MSVMVCSLLNTNVVYAICLRALNATRLLVRTAQPSILATLTTLLVLRPLKRRRSNVLVVLTASIALKGVRRCGALDVIQHLTGIVVEWSNQIVFITLTGLNTSATKTMDEHH